MVGIFTHRTPADADPDVAHLKLDAVKIQDSEFKLNK